MHPELLLMLLADARLPTSGHTQSGGLEPALLGGLDPADLDAYCTTRLETVTLTEAATAVVCRSRALAGRPTDDVESAWAARTPAPHYARRPARWDAPIAEWRCGCGRTRSSWSS